MLSQQWSEVPKHAFFHKRGPHSKGRKSRIDRSPSLCYRTQALTTRVGSQKVCVPCTNEALATLGGCLESPIPLHFLTTPVRIVLLVPAREAQTEALTAKASVLPSGCAAWNRARYLKKGGTLFQSRYPPLLLLSSSSSPLLLPYSKIRTPMCAKNKCPLSCGIL